MFSNYPPGCSGPPEDKLWDQCWDEIARMDWDELVELAGEQCVGMDAYCGWQDDDFEKLQEAACLALYESKCQDWGCDE